MTNTSADKSLNSSMRNDNIQETRIKAANSSRPFDVISEYRSTIQQRYFQKFQGNSDVGNNSTRESQTKTEESENMSVTKDINSNTTYPSSKYQDNDSSKRNRRHKSCIKTKSQTPIVSRFKEDRNKRRRHGHRGSLSSNISVTLSTKNYSTRDNSQQKPSSKKKFETIASKLNIGELVKFLKLKKPNKEDLNISQMILILVYPNLSSQLSKLGMKDIKESK